ncbi:MAG: BON domain-containing protein [Desulfobacterales bacterium]
MNRRFMLIFLLTLVVSGCTGMSPVGEAREDKALAAQVKAALIKDPQIDAAAIGVTADGGQIRLAGFVESEGERRRAEHAALKIEGVVEVVNKIEVK